MIEGNPETIRRFLLDKTKEFACYRLPDSLHMVCLAGTTDVVEHIDGKGFAVVPFVPSESCPAIMIRPNKVTVFSLPAAQTTSYTDLRPDIVPEERDIYAKGFAQCKKALSDGTVRKVVYSRRHVVPLISCGTEMLARYFLRACRLYPHNYIALWHTSQTGTWLIASPELLVKTRNDADGISGATMALAGTLDAKAEYLSDIDSWDKKNREEQRLVTEYISRQLEDYCTDFQVSSIHPVQSGKVAHLCTRLSFRAQTADAGLIARRLHPTPAICGLPAAEASRLIAEAEISSRRYYAGYSGPCEMTDGQTYLYVSLRCMEVHERSATLYAGSGLLPESTEESEWEETQKKLAAITVIIS